MYDCFMPYIILFLGICYALTIAPGLTWAHASADGGDLISALATGGVPHPGGYPLYLSLARPFQLLPFGSLAFRTNLFSALCTLAACLLLYYLLLRVLRGGEFSKPIALFSALLYGTLPMVWGQALVTEVYALHQLMVMLCLYLLLLDENPPPAWTLGLVFGLSASNHLTSFLLLPLLFLGSEQKLFSTPKTISLRLIGFVIGLSLYLLLPLRAAQNPPINWGDASTLNGFLWLVSGSAYKTYLFTLSFQELFSHLRFFAGVFLTQFTIFGLLLVFYGAFSQTQRRLVLITAWVFLSFTLFSLGYASSDSQVNLFPVLICMTIWLSLGAQDILRSGFFTNRYLKNGALFLLCLFLVIRVVQIFPQVNLSNEHAAEDYIASVKQKAPANSILFVTGDGQLFSLWYMQYGIHERNDLIVVSEGLAQFAWYRKQLRSLYGAIQWPPENAFQPIEVITLNQERTICFITPEDFYCD
jgi:hypothetical protein